MNKNNIKISFLFFGLLFLLIPGKALAADDKILMYLDCSYNISYGADNIKSSNVSIYSSDLHIAYTEILDYDGNTYKVKVTDASGSFYNNVNENFNDKFTPSIRETDQTRSTFTSAYAKNDNSCPKFMTLEQYSGSKYTVLFSNELNDTCSGTPGTQCKMIYNYSKTNYQVYISPKEDVWSYYTGENKDSICDKLNIDLSVSAGKKIQILATYAKDSKYEEYTNWTAPKNVDTVWFEDIANLARNKTVKTLAFDPDTDSFAGTTDVRFAADSDSLSFDSYCKMPKPAFTAKKTCSTYDDIKATISSKMNNAFAASKSIDDVAAKYLSANPQNGSYSAKSYSTEKDATKLEKIGTEIDTALKSSTFINVSTEFLNYLTSLSTDGTLCQEAKEKVLAMIDTYTDYNTNRGEVIQKLKETLGNIQSRLEAMKETEKAAAFDEYIDNAAAMEAEIKTVSVQARNSYLTGNDFKIGAITGATCNIISADLQKFLQTIIDYIRIAGITLAVVLGILDYIKVIFGSDDKSMAKANKNFATRLIAVALLFLIPAVLNFVLGLFNILGTGSAGTCGIK